MKDSEFLPNKGYYKSLKVFKYTLIIYGITFKFVDRFLSIGDRTRDQMLQSARSGKQNIAEGSSAGVVSKQSEINLTNVAKASLVELLEDYEDFLRVRELEQWDVKDPRTTQTRNVVKKKLNNYNRGVIKYFLEASQTRNAETLANIAITMIHMADKMLQGLQDRQKKDFLENGGLKEQMYRARLKHRDSNSPKSSNSPDSPGTHNSPGSSVPPGSPIHPSSPSTPSSPTQ